MSEENKSTQKLGKVIKLKSILDQGGKLKDKIDKSVTVSEADYAAAIMADLMCDIMLAPMQCVFNLIQELSGTFERKSVIRSTLLLSLIPGVLITILCVMVGEWDGAGVFVGGLIAVMVVYHMSSNSLVCDLHNVLADCVHVLNSDSKKSILSDIVDINDLSDDTYL